MRHICIAIVGLLGAAIGCAKPAVSVGVQASRWQVGEGTGLGSQVDARLALSDRLAVQASRAWQTSSEPPVGQAPIPHLRGALVFTPGQNPYLVPHVMLGADKTRYTEERWSLIAGAGIELVIRSWLRIVAQWTLIAPDPVEVVDQIKQRRLDGDMMPIEGMLGEHYNLNTTEITFGYRLAY